MPPPTPSLSVIPHLWTCCSPSCSPLLPDRLSHPEQVAIPPVDPNAVSFPGLPLRFTHSAHGSNFNGNGNENPAYAHEVCKGCDQQACCNCVLYSVSEEGIDTFGGKNLMPGRLDPAGWECCSCRGVHFAGSRYRAGEYAVMAGAGTESTQLVKLRCGRQRTHTPPLQNSQNWKDICPHIVCEKCKVVNQFGEVLARMDTGMFILREATSPLRRNLVYFQARRAWLFRETSQGGHLAAVGAGWIAGEREKAARDLDAAQEVVERAKWWAVELRRTAEGMKGEMERGTL